MSTGNKITLWGAIIGAVALILAAIIQIQPWKNTDKKLPKIKSEIILGGTVVDEKTNLSISQAEVSVVGRNEQYYTEENGNFKIILNDTITGNVRIRVTKSNYKPYDKSFDIPNDNIIIQLTESKSY